MSSPTDPDADRSWRVLKDSDDSVVMAIFGFGGAIVGLLGGLGADAGFQRDGLTSSGQGWVLFASLFFLAAGAGLAAYPPEALLAWAVRHGRLSRRRYRRAAWVAGSVAAAVAGVVLPIAILRIVGLDAYVAGTAVLLAAITVAVVAWMVWQFVLGRGRPEGRPRVEPSSGAISHSRMRRPSKWRR